MVIAIWAIVLKFSLHWTGVGFPLPWLLYLVIPEVSEEIRFVKKDVSTETVLHNMTYF